MKKARKYLLLMLIMCFSVSCFADPKVIHVVVALCDNKYQGIVPVPAAIGNGQDPKNNLYWGAAYGFKTFFSKQKEWQVVQVNKPQEGKILEEIIYKHKSKDVYIIAQAYDGKYIDNTIDDFINYSAGKKQSTFTLDNKKIIAGGGKANLVVYIGHNGLMEWSWSKFFGYETSWASNSKEEKEKQKSRYAAVFACKSQKYFSKPLLATGISPLILTMQYMAPEAYSVHAMIDSWLNGESKANVRSKVASAYSKYQNLKKPAMSMFTTEYSQ
ncbi:hypothetical protein J3U16_10435 [Gilliamella sp. B3023]|uniref:hypothetical protein n=1 Tax=unclassified Gilliamella TaxID=2685620 RepID=UPI00226AB7A1|nr:MULTISPECIES: hypothetical protein [unclassified Gilliamella]MCX8586765.1 hypothetical protein [Gilliamella sp. B3562]MCX8675704.1 hypothetical protein [Gilliamella sp. B3023]MCX8686445.1 hypothetical protein [Gilliamella sp. B2864]